MQDTTRQALHDSALLGVASPLIYLAVLAWLGHRHPEAELIRLLRSVESPIQALNFLIPVCLFYYVVGVVEILLLSYIGAAVHTHASVTWAITAVCASWFALLGGVFVTIASSMGATEFILVWIVPSSPSLLVSLFRMLQ